MRAMRNTRNERVEESDQRSKQASGKDIWKGRDFYLVVNHSKHNVDNVPEGRFYCHRPDWNIKSQFYFKPDPRLVQTGGNQQVGHACARAFPLSHRRGKCDRGVLLPKRKTEDRLVLSMSGVFGALLTNIGSSDIQNAPVCGFQSPNRFPVPKVELDESNRLTGWGEREAFVLHLTHFPDIKSVRSCNFLTLEIKLI